MSLQRKVLKKTPLTSTVLDILLSEPPLYSPTTATTPRSPEDLPRYFKLPPPPHTPKPPSQFTPIDPKTIRQSSILSDEEASRRKSQQLHFDADFSKELNANPYVKILTSPIRLDRLRGSLYPRELLVPMGFEECTEKETQPSANEEASTANTVSTSIRLYPRLCTNKLDKRAGSTSYIPCHESAPPQLSKQWKSFVPTVSTTSIRITQGRFMERVSRQLNSAKKPSKSSKGKAPPDFGPVIPQLLVDEMVHLLESRILKHHLVRLQTKPLPSESPYYFRLQWHDSPSDNTTPSPHCIEVLNIPDILQEAHSSQLRELLSKSLKTFAETSYADIPSNAGIDLHVLLLKYKSYFGEP